MSKKVAAMRREPVLAEPAGQAGTAMSAPWASLRDAVWDPAYADEMRHVRLRTVLAGEIAAGTWLPGDKLPSEGELTRAVGLSLGTVQKVLARLAAEGLLVRRHGHGTFVAGHASQSSQLMHFRFVGDDGQAVAPVYAEALERRVIRTEGPWSEFLSGSISCIRVRRRINVAQEFDCISDFYVDASRFKALLDMPFQELHRVVIRNVLARHFNAPTLALSQRIYSSRFGSAVRKLLKRDASNDFGLVLEVLSYSHRHEPISFQNIFIPSDVRRLDVPSPRLLR